RREGAFFCDRVVLPSLGSVVGDVFLGALEELVLGELRIADLVLAELCFVELRLVDDLGDRFWAGLAELCFGDDLIELCFRELCFRELCFRELCFRELCFRELCLVELCFGDDLGDRFWAGLVERLAERLGGERRIIALRRRLQHLGRLRALLERRRVWHRDLVGGRYRLHGLGFARSALRSDRVRFVDGGALLRSALRSDRVRFVDGGALLLGRFGRLRVALRGVVGRRGRRPGFLFGVQRRSGGVRR